MTPARSPTLDLIRAGDDEWEAADGHRLATTALTAAVGHGRGPSVATKVLHLKRPRFFPILDDLVAVMLGVNMNDAPAAGRIKNAVRLLTHLRAQGRANLQQLETIQTMLIARGIDVHSYGSCDAILWFAHPAAGVPNVAREITVTATVR